jgi:hypothetical protein
VDLRIAAHAVEFKLDQQKPARIIAQRAFKSSKASAARCLLSKQSELKTIFTST